MLGPLLGPLLRPLLGPLLRLLLSLLRVSTEESWIISGDPELISPLTQSHNHQRYLTPDIRPIMGRV
jgi:hypothetical protein